MAGVVMTLAILLLINVNFLRISLFLQNKFVYLQREGWVNLQRPALIPARLFSLAFLLALFFHCLCSIFFRISCIESCF